ncbi:MAG: hypothetical protein Q9197_002409, partial [Variospora fuerteventurae]
MDVPYCPLCTFSSSSPYFLTQHVEAVHPEKDEPPFVSRHFLDVDQADDGGCEVVTTCGGAPSPHYIECECGEAILLSEFDDHVQLHAAESAAMAVGTAQLPVGGTSSSSQQCRAWPLIAAPVEPMDRRSASSGGNNVDSPSHSNGASPSKSQHSSRINQAKQTYTVKEWIDLLPAPNASLSRTKAYTTAPKNARRLGKAELGPYAHEEQMPAWLHRHLERGAKVSVVNQISPCGRSLRLEVVANECPGILQVLAQLCEQDCMLSKVYLCHPGVQHIFKTAKEGGFCGYRNIQMMISYIQAARAQGYDCFNCRIPSILDLQELIESAWDRGINAVGKVETGGIRGTRKYIGTPEAQTLLVSLMIGCEASAFNDAENPPAFRKLYEEVERYFVGHSSPSPEKVCRTSLPPIYFQHP